MIGGALFAALRAIVIAGFLGLLVHRFTFKLPVPRRVTVGFAAAHLAAALLYAILWVVLTALTERLAHGIEAPVELTGALPFVALGVAVYLGVATVSYVSRHEERAARADAAAVRAQLDALRSQLNPHFLFNALHSVVQLIPAEPAKAAQAAELLAGLLHAAIREDRDLIALDEERAFVERYVELELLRFGDRLDVAFSVGDELAEARVPAFALQTLVENAVRHGAEPQNSRTRVTVTAHVRGGDLELSVSDDGVGAEMSALDARAGSGLKRLRERLKTLYGDRASLTFEAAPGSGFRARLAVPLDRTGEE